jgi:glycolate dehydrogenase FAD-binding subunit
LTGSRVLEHEPGDLTCVVDADIRLSELQATLRPFGQRFSLDPPGDPQLGDCLLEDLAGPLSHGFGTMRDLVIGITVVLPDGMRASSGGKVVKNVAGYDLARLFCGSRGRLGSVERLALRLHPQPEVTRSLVTNSTWAELQGSHLVPSAVDCVDRKLYVLLEGSRAAVDAQAASLGGDEVDPWDDLRALQATLPGRVRWDGQEASLVRPGPRIAYVEDAPAERWNALAERVMEALCSAS